MIASRKHQHILKEKLEGALIKKYFCSDGFENPLLATHTNASRQEALWMEVQLDMHSDIMRPPHLDPMSYLWPIPTTCSCKSRYRVCGRAAPSDEVLTSYLSCAGKTSPPGPALPLRSELWNGPGC